MQIQYFYDRIPLTAPPNALRAAWEHAARTSNAVRLAQLTRLAAGLPEDLLAQARTSSHPEVAAAWVLRTPRSAEELAGIVAAERRGEVLAAVVKGSEDPDMLAQLAALDKRPVALALAHRAGLSDEVAVTALRTLNRRASKATMASCLAAACSLARALKNPELLTAHKDELTGACGAAALITLVPDDSAVLHAAINGLPELIAASNAATGRAQRSMYHLVSQLCENEFLTEEHRHALLAVLGGNSYFQGPLTHLRQRRTGVASSRDQLLEILATGSGDAFRAAFAIATAQLAITPPVRAAIAANPHLGVDELLVVLAVGSIPVRELTVPFTDELLVTLVQGGARLPTHIVNQLVDAAQDRPAVLAAVMPFLTPSQLSTFQGELTDELLLSASWDNVCSVLSAEDWTTLADRHLGEDPLAWHQFAELQVSWSGSAGALFGTARAATGA